MIGIILRDVLDQEFNRPNYRNSWLSLYLLINCVLQWLQANVLFHFELWATIKLQILDSFADVEGVFPTECHTEQQA